MQEKNSSKIFTQFYKFPEKVNRIHPLRSQTGHAPVLMLDTPQEHRL
jgi:hypothetical protein